MESKIKQLKGIDLSHWNKITSYDLPVDFVILKATQGNGYVDPTYHERVEEFRKRGFQVGHYAFADGTKHEAEHFLKTVDYKKGDIVALDYEIHLANPVDWCLDWLIKVEKELGTKALIYLNVSTVDSYNWTPVINKGYGLWLADYSDLIARTGQWDDCVIRQETSKGKIKGIIGNVDIDFANKLTNNKMDKIEETKKAIKKYIFDFKNFINEKEDVKIARKIKELVEDGNKLIEQNKKLKEENAELSSKLKNNSQNTIKVKELQVSLERMEDTLNGYILENKRLEEENKNNIYCERTVVLQKEKINSQTIELNRMKNAHTKDVKATSITTALTFLLSVVKNKIIK